MTQGDRRTGIARVVHLAGRSGRFVTDREYRLAVRARSHLRALRRINADVRYVGIDDQGGRTFVHVGDDVLSPWVLAVGHFQRMDFATVWALAQQLAPRRTGGVFVDVGANVGTTTLYAMRTGDFASAVVMEPGPDNLDVLRLNLMANRLEGSVTVVAAACGAASGTAELLLSSESQADHRVARGGEELSSHGTSTLVRTARLDDVLRDAGVEPEQVSLVWIDTQGHEPDVLAGAADVMASGAPFCVEFWPEQYQRSGTLDDLIEQISGSFGSLIDVHDPQLRQRPVHDLRALAEALMARRDGQTDLLLLPSTADIR